MSGRPVAWLLQAQGCYLMIMQYIEPKLQVAILKTLRDASAAVTSEELARQIEAYGFHVRPRTLRLYLQQMEAEGLVAGAKRGRGGGRTLTERGTAEIEDATVLDRIGFTAAKVDRLAWEMSFDINTMKGQVVLNVTLIERAQLAHAVREMTPVFRAGLSMGSFAAIFPENSRAGDIRIPDGYVGIGTVCSVTVNALLLNERVPAVSRFGAVLEIRDYEPARFTELIAYDGTTVDPLEIFIKAKLTDVHSAAVTGNGRLGASFREIPTSALDTVTALKARLEELGLGGILMVGKPNQPLLDFPVHEGRTGLIVTGGLNPPAAIEEAGIETRNTALCTLFDFSKLKHYQDLPSVIWSDRKTRDYSG